MLNEFIKNTEEYTGAEVEIHKISIETTMPYKNRIQKCIITIKNDKVKVKPKKLFIYKIHKRIRKLLKKCIKWYNNLSDDAEFVVIVIIMVVISIFIYIVCFVLYHPR